MAVLRKIDNQHIIYEEKTLGVLVAIKKENTAQIKRYWKQNKGKSEQPDDTIQGFSFVHDEEQESLRIDFENEMEFKIKNLEKFK